MDTLTAQLVVIGSGPGGYAAAFRAADLGMSVVLIERYDTLGGVCLNVGCIPSKALLHVAEVINDADDASDFGVRLGKTKVDIPQVLAHKSATVKKLTAGLDGLAKRRKVQRLQGEARFVDAHTLTVCGETTAEVRFEQCIVACGSRSVKLGFLPDDPRIVTSTGALDLPVTQGKMLVIGGGVIGCEMATVYQALGMQVDVVEMSDQIMPGADTDIIKPCQDLMQKRGVSFHTNTTVCSVTAHKKHLAVGFDKAIAGSQEHTYDLILQAVGRVPNTQDLGLDLAGIACCDRGFIQVNSGTLATNKDHIFAIGDIIGHPMLAHKATAQGRLVAELCSGKKVRYDVQAIPSVAYTDPEVAWVGMTEQMCQQQQIAYKKGVFPWAANARALCYKRSEGLTKLLSCKESGRILGAAVVGRNAGDLIAELGFALEMGAHVEDVALTVHAHPTLAETVGLAAEVCEGTVTDL
mgnify:CR=1 FL=1